MVTNEEVDMLVGLGQFTVRRGKAVLIASVVFFALAGIIGGGVAQHLSSGGFDDPGAESTRALQACDEDWCRILNVGLGDHSRRARRSSFR